MYIVKYKGKYNTSETWSEWPVPAMTEGEIWNIITDIRQYIGCSFKWRAYKQELFREGGQK